MRRSSWQEDFYQKLVNEEDARVCEAIDENACREVPGNFFKIITSHFCSKLGDALANPKIILPWILQTVQAPVYLLGLLVPIRESGSLMPQLLIAGPVRRMPCRKWAWVVGALLQALAVMAMGLVAWQWSGALAGWAIVGLLVLFSLARGLSSVASKDVLGKTIPKTRRGQVNGWAASAAGLVTVALALVLLGGAERELTPALCALLLLGAGAMWVVAALVFMRIREFPGETAGGANGIVEAVRRLALLKADPPFRRFVITRSLLLCSALTAPYYVALAQSRLGTQAQLLGLFVLASGLASLLSAPFWGRFADVSSRQVMIWAAWLTAALGVLVFALESADSPWLEFLWLLPLLYFLLSVAHQGVRVGRKTYVVDLAEGNRRTDYVAVSNSVIGLVLLLMGLSGWVASAWGLGSTILLLSLLGAAGAVMAAGLPDVSGK